MHSTAVVIGAGVTGLAAAQVLAASSDRVLVLDRDRLPDRAAPRRGVPQGNHGHVLLGAGQRELDQLFPGMLAELLSAGAVPFDPSADMIIYRGGPWGRPASDLTLVSFSRPLLEQAMRVRIAALSHVEIRSDVAVAGLIGDSGRVTGVTLDDGTTVDAALVADCTGRGSRSDRWLQALGCPTPTVTEVVVNVGYATRLVRRRPGDLPDAKAIFVLPDPPDETRAGLVLPIEDDRWIVSLGGWHGDFPADGSGFLDHARRLPSSAVADLLERAEPLTDVHIHRLASNRRRHFENLADVPRGYVALGDAVCSFNPVYGQGMTIGILEAAELRRRLSADPDLDVREFYAWMGDLLKVPWRFAAGADFRWPQTKGDRPKDSALLRRYTARVQRATARDPEVRRVFTTVQHMLTPPSALFSPRIAWRVLRKGPAKR